MILASTTLDISFIESSPKVMESPVVTQFSTGLSSNITSVETDQLIVHWVLGYAVKNSLESLKCSSMPTTNSPLGP